MGSDHCLQVHYEQLVLDLNQALIKIQDFLKMPAWDSNVLEGNRFFDTDSISNWHHQLPKDIVQDMKNLAPMLEALDYDPNDQAPKYSKVKDEL